VMCADPEYEGCDAYDDDGGGMDWGPDDDGPPWEQLEQGGVLPTPA
jgi:hypothetical protein